LVEQAELRTRAQGFELGSWLTASVPLVTPASPSLPHRPAKLGQKSLVD